MKTIRKLFRGKNMDVHSVSTTGKNSKPISFHGTSAWVFLWFGRCVFCTLLLLVDLLPRPAKKVLHLILFSSMLIIFVSIASLFLQNKEDFHPFPFRSRLTKREDEGKHVQNTFLKVNNHTTIGYHKPLKPNFCHSLLAFKHWTLSNVVKTYAIYSWPSNIKDFIVHR